MRLKTRYTKVFIVGLIVLFPIFINVCTTDGMVLFGNQSYAKNVIIKLQDDLNASDFKAVINYEDIDGKKHRQLKITLLEVRNSFNTTISVKTFAAAKELYPLIKEDQKFDDFKFEIIFADSIKNHKVNDIVFSMDNLSFTYNKYDLGVY